MFDRFVLKTKEQRAAEKALMDKSPLKTLTLEEFLESERHKLTGTLTPVTPESFAEWKKKRLDKKAAEEQVGFMMLPRVRNTLSYTGANWIHDRPAKQRKQLVVHCSRVATGAHRATTRHPSPRARTTKTTTRGTWRSSEKRRRLFGKRRRTSVLRRSLACLQPIQWLRTMEKQARLETLPMRQQGRTRQPIPTAMGKLLLQHEQNLGFRYNTIKLVWKGDFGVVLTNRNSRRTSGQVLGAHQMAASDGRHRQPKSGCTHLSDDIVQLTLTILAASAGIHVGRHATSARHTRGMEWLQWLASQAKPFENKGAFRAKKKSIWHLSSHYEYCATTSQVLSCSLAPSELLNEWAYIQFLGEARSWLCVQIPITVRDLFSPILAHICQSKANNWRSAHIDSPHQDLSCHP